MGEKLCDNTCMKSFSSLAFSILFMVPVLAFVAADVSAQETDEALRASIQSALMSDPATDALPPEELEKLVSALAAEASKTGVEPSDITYVPRPPADLQSAGAGGDLPADCDVWCVFAHAYGLDGVDPTTPILLLISSGLLVMIFRRAMRPQHIEHFTGVKPKPVPATPVPPRTVPTVPSAPAPSPSPTPEAPVSPENQPPRPQSPLQPYV